MFSRIDPTRLLISLGASVESQDNNDNTSLHWAVESRNASAISMLIDKNAPLYGANNKVLLYSIKLVFIQQIFFINLL